MIIKENILIYSPVLFIELMDELIENRKYRNRSNFTNEAIKRLLEVEGINLTPIDAGKKREEQMAWAEEIKDL